MMRILGGEFRGRRLRVPRGGNTRPSTGRLREALFSVLQSRLRGAEVVDLFAGSGSLGLEALSRGASSATFVDHDPAAVRAIRENVDRLGVGERCRIRRLDAREWLHSRRRDEATSELVFADPPYEEALSQDVLLLAAGLVECGRISCFCLEHEARLPIEGFDSVRVQTRRYGRSAFTLMEGAVE